MMRGIISSACFVFFCNAAQNKQYMWPLPGECTSSELASGTYQVVLHHDQYAFLVDCMVDGTMYLDDQYLALYHHYQTIGTVLEFELIVAAEYNTIDDVDESAISDERLHFPYPLPKVNEPASAQIDDDSLQDEALSSTQQKSVNMAAQYIVYGVIIAMALIFSVGICILMYWWFCRNSAVAAAKLSDCAAADTMDEALDETTPFLDIRGVTTIQKQLHQQRNNSRHRAVRPTGSDDREQEEEDLLQRGRQNVYDDIDGADKDEDGDDLIAHYGATNETDINQSNNSLSSSGYVIATCPAP